MASSLSIGSDENRPFRLELTEARAEKMVKNAKVYLPKSSWQSKKMPMTNYLSGMLQN